MNKIYEILCTFDFHSWKYKKEKHMISGEGFKTLSMNVDMRECSHCKKRQHHMMPKGTGFNSWRNASFKEGEDIEVELVTSWIKNEK